MIRDRQKYANTLGWGWARWRGADAGPIAALPASERFGWLAAPSSTIVQASEVHTGLQPGPRGDARCVVSSGWWPRPPPPAP